MELIKPFIDLAWFIVSNSWILAFIVTGIIMRVSYACFDIWYGVKGGAVLYAIVALVLNFIL